MIAYIKGTIKHKNEKSIIILCGDIGYEIYVPEYIILSKNTEDKLELYTYQQLSSRDETLDLFGFLSVPELQFFKQLISISGVGPRSAIAVLSVAKLDDLKTTISQGDPALLQKVAGIGKKTAERIIIELKDKLEHTDSFGNSTGVRFSPADSDIYDALEQLGYKIADIREALKHVPHDTKTTEDKIKAALKLLGKQK